MNSIPQNFYRISIKALILDDKKRFLLFREENGQWDLPGGGLDYGETPQECLKRELKEEGGLEIISIKPYPSSFVTGLRENGTWKGIVLYETKVKNINFTPSEECVDVSFFTKEEALKENLYPSVKEFVLQYDVLAHQ